MENGDSQTDIKSDVKDNDDGSNTLALKITDGRKSVLSEELRRQSHTIDADQKTETEVHEEQENDENNLPKLKQESDLQTDSKSRVEYLEDDQKEEITLTGEDIIEKEKGEQNIEENDEDANIEDDNVEGNEEQKEEPRQEKNKEEPEIVEEEEDKYIEEPPPDPAAPYDLTDSKEALKPPFELKPEQLSEVEQLWELYQDYTPAYTDISGYITEKELVYMLKALLLMTYTPEQLQELIAFGVRPPHPQGHISFEQFLKIVTIRQRDYPVEEELRAALQVLDPDKSGTIDREYMREVLLKLGHKLPPKQVNNLIKEVDISNDGTIGIEDIVGTVCIDLNSEDIIKLRESLNPPEEENTSLS